MQSIKQKKGTEQRYLDISCFNAQKSRLAISSVRQMLSSIFLCLFFYFFMLNCSGTRLCLKSVNSALRDISKFFNQIGYLYHHNNVIFPLFQE